ncbi:MAG: PTS glucose transporter subunit IIA [Eubacteriales bacterium]|nr:PTS glucose transporter subunit IIA [Eubacteriales bacterium]
MTTATYNFMAPVTGKCVPIEAFHTDLFGEKVLGEGVSIFPAENTVVAPCDGIVSRACENSHIVTLLDSVHNLELMLGANIEAANADFTMCVKTGETVKAGSPLFTCNVNDIHAQGGFVDVSCIVTNLPTADVSVNCGDVVRGKSRILSCECAG